MVGGYFVAALHGGGGVKYVELLANKARHTSYGPENNAAPAVVIHGKERRERREERRGGRRGGEP